VLLIVTGSAADVAKIVAGAKVSATVKYTLADPLLILAYKFRSQRPPTAIELGNAPVRIVNDIILTDVYEVPSVALTAVPAFNVVIRSPGIVVPT
jgi:hypothetical protein